MENVQCCCCWKLGNFGNCSRQHIDGDPFERQWNSLGDGIAFKTPLQELMEQVLVVERFPITRRPNGAHSVNTNRNHVRNSVQNYFWNNFALRIAVVRSLAEHVKARRLILLLCQGGGSADGRNEVKHWSLGQCETEAQHLQHTQHILTQRNVWQRQRYLSCIHKDVRNVLITKLS